MISEFPEPKPASTAARGRASFGLVFLCVGAISACGRVLEYPEAEPEQGDALCHDAADNDFDGKVDCDDADCNGSCAEESTAECSDARDNDLDGLTDDADPQCWPLSPPNAERCAEKSGVSIVENFDLPSWDLRWSSWQRWGIGSNGFVIYGHSEADFHSDVIPGRQDPLLAFAGNTSRFLNWEVGTLVRHRPFAGSWQDFDLSFNAAVPYRTLLRVGLVPIALAPVTEAPLPGAETALFALTLDGRTSPPKLIVDVEGARAEQPFLLRECSGTSAFICDSAEEEMPRFRLARDPLGFRVTVTYPDGVEADVLAEIQPSASSFPAARLVLWGGSGEALNVGRLDDLVLKVAPEWPCGFPVPQIPGKNCDFVSFEPFGQSLSVARADQGDYCALVTASQGVPIFESTNAPLAAPEKLTAWRSQDGQSWTTRSSLDAPAIDLPEGSALVGGGIAADAQGFQAVVAYREGGAGLVRLGFAEGDSCETFGELVPGPVLFDDAEPPSLVIAGDRHDVYFSRPPTDQTRRTLWRVALDRSEPEPELLAELPADVLAPVSVALAGARDLVLTHPSAVDSNVSGVGLLVARADGRRWERVGAAPLLELPARLDVFNGQGRIAFDDLGVHSAALAWHPDGGFLIYAGQATRGTAGASNMAPVLSVGTARLAAAGSTLPDAAVVPPSACGDGTCSAAEDCGSCEADCRCAAVELLGDPFDPGTPWALRSTDENREAIRYVGSNPPGLNWSGGAPTWSVLPFEQAIIGDFELSFDLLVPFSDKAVTSCSAYVGLGMSSPDGSITAGAFARIRREGCFYERYSATPFVVAGDQSFGPPEAELSCLGEGSLSGEQWQHLVLRRQGSAVSVLSLRADGCGAFEQETTYAGALPPLSALFVGFGGGQFEECPSSVMHGTITNLSLRLLEDPTDCPEDQELCGGHSEEPSCIDTSQSSEHCGACDRACRVNESCQEGDCVCADHPGIRDCAGACVDPQTSLEHCGECGHSCEEECVLGFCDPVWGDCTSPFEVPPQGGDFTIVFPETTEPAGYPLCDHLVVNETIGSWTPEQSGFALLEVDAGELDPTDTAPLDTVLAITDYPTCEYWTSCNDDTVRGLQLGSHLELDVVAGTTYRIAIGTWDYSAARTQVATLRVRLR